MFLAVSVAAIAPLMPATATASATATTVATPSCGASSAPLLPDIRGWTRLAYRMNRMSGIGPRRLLQLELPALPRFQQRGRLLTELFGPQKTMCTSRDP